MDCRVDCRCQRQQPCALPEYINATDCETTAIARSQGGPSSSDRNKNAGAEAVSRDELRIFGFEFRCNRTHTTAKFVKPARIQLARHRRPRVDSCIAAAGAPIAPPLGRAQ